MTRSTRSTASSRDRARSRLARTLAATVLVAGTVLLPTSATLARSSDWTLWRPPVGVVVACGDVPVNLDFPTNREYLRELPLTPGTSDILQFTGYLEARFSTPYAARTYNISGPGVVTTYANGDVLVRSEGHYNFAVTPEQAVQLGVPQIFNTVGLMELVIHPDGSMTPIRIPSNVTDVCADLGL